MLIFVLIAMASSLIYCIFSVDLKWYFRIWLLLYLIKIKYWNRIRLKWEWISKTSSMFLRLHAPISAVSSNFYFIKPEFQGIDPNIYIYIFYGHIHWYIPIFFSFLLFFWLKKFLLFCSFVFLLTVIDLYIFCLVGYHCLSIRFCFSFFMAFSFSWI